MKEEVGAINMLHIKIFDRLDNPFMVISKNKQ